MVRDFDCHIIDYEGATCFAVGLALVQIPGAILRVQKSVLTVFTRPDGEFGIQNVCLSLPCIVSVSGAERILESSLPEHEQAALSVSAAILE